MLALVIDTSSAAVSAGVVEVTDADPVVLAERVTVNARAHGELLAPSVRDVLAEAGVQMADLAAVVAGLGPGPFTGLRVGLVTAAAIADARNLPTYGVCSLDAIAVAAAASGSLIVAGDARRKEIYWARYAGGKRLDGPYVNRPADVAARIAVSSTAGAGARLYEGVLGGRLLDPDYPPMNGLAALGADRIRAGAPSETLTPLYLRRPDAVAPSEYKNVTPS